MFSFFRPFTPDFRPLTPENSPVRPWRPKTKVHEDPLEYLCPAMREQILKWREAAEKKQENEKKDR